MEKIDLHDFGFQLTLQKLRMEDFDQLIAMQKICFPGMELWSHENTENPKPVVAGG